MPILISSVLLILNLFLWPSFWAFFLILIISGIFFYTAYKKPIAGSKFATMILLAALLLRIAYVGNTPFDVRAHDIGGHIEYIKYIAHNFSLPSDSDCWQCYHPPLYYIIAAPVCLATACAKTDMIFLQLLSLLMNLGFLVYGIKLLRLFIPAEYDKKYFNLAVLLFVFWPSSIIDSARIGNDDLIYLFIAAGLFYFCRWYQHCHKKDLILSVLISAGSLFVKNNGLILVVSFGAILLFKLIFHDGKKHALAGLLSLAVLTLFGSAWLYNPGEGEFMLVSNSRQLLDQLKVGNEIGNYVKFDIQSFLAIPFTDPWNDVGGRQYLLNFLFKTALFGEYQYYSVYLDRLAVILSYLFIFLLLSGFAGMAVSFSKIMKFGHGYKSAEILLLPLVFLFFAAIIYFRIRYPFAPSGDFRYILPVIIPFSALVALGGNFLSTLSSGRAKGILTFPGYVASSSIEFGVYLFVFFSSLFFIILSFL